MTHFVKLEYVTVREAPCVFGASCLKYVNVLIYVPPRVRQTKSRILYAMIWVLYQMNFSVGIIFHFLLRYGLFDRVFCELMLYLFNSERIEEPLRDVESVLISYTYMNV